MRTDPAQAQATQQEGKKKDARDLDGRHQKVSPAHESETQADDGAVAQDRVRSQDPNFGRGHH
ncbi:hypothetical protein [Lysobacter xanthus]